MGVKALDVNGIMDLVDRFEELDVEAVYMDPPEAADSDGYDNSDTEEGNPNNFSWNILKVCL